MSDKLSTYKNGTSEPRRWFRDTRLAWICWFVFTCTVIGLTLGKTDRIDLRSGERVWARVVRQTRDHVDVRIGAFIREIAMSDVVSMDRYANSSVTPEYRHGSLGWWRNEDIYPPGKDGFLYPPQAAILWTPFAILPAWARETLWRTLSLATYALGVWMLAGVVVRAWCGWTHGESFRSVISRPEFATVFTLATFLSIPAAIGSANNGQTNLIVAGLLAIAAACMADRRWWFAAVLMLVALPLKPPVIVLTLLAGAVYPPMSWRLVLGGMVLLAVPFLHPDTHYVATEYAAAIRKMSEAAAPLPGRWQDLGGMLTDLHLSMPDIEVMRLGNAEVTLWTIVRASVAVFTLAACWLARRRFGLSIGVVYMLTLGVIYVLLMSPRTEGVTYALLGPSLALFSTVEIIRRNWWSAALLILFCLLLQFSLVFTKPLQSLTGLEQQFRLRPMCTAFFAVYVVAQIVRARSSLANHPSRQGQACGFTSRAAQ